jgi:hypothetical protein
VEGTKPDPRIQTGAVRKKETPFLYSSMQFIVIDVPGESVASKSFNLQPLLNKSGKVNFIFARK